MEKKVKRILIALIALIFLAFYTFGYDLPYVKNPNLTDPLLTPVLLWLMVVMVTVALLLAVVSGVMSIRKNKGRERLNNINISRIGWCVALPIVLIMIVSFLLGTTSQITVNNHPYENSVWLRLGDMFIYTSLIEMVLAVVMIVVCSIKTRI